MAYKIHNSPKIGRAICVAWLRACPYAGLAHEGNEAATIFVFEPKGNHALLEQHHLIYDATAPIYTFDPAVGEIRKWNGDTRLCNAQFSSFNKSSLEQFVREWEASPNMRIGGRGYRRILENPRTELAYRWEAYLLGSGRWRKNRGRGDELYRYINTQLDHYIGELDNPKSLHYNPGGAQAMRHLQHQIRQDDRGTWPANVAALKAANHWFNLQHDPDYFAARFGPNPEGDMAKQAAQTLLGRNKLAPVLTQELNQAVAQLDGVTSVPVGYDDYLDSLTHGAQIAINAKEGRPGKPWHIDANRTIRRCSHFSYKQGEQTHSTCRYDPHYATFDQAKAALNELLYQRHILNNNVDIAPRNLLEVHRDLDPDLLARAVTREQTRMGEHADVIGRLYANDVPGKPIGKKHCHQAELDLVDNEYAMTGDINAFFKNRVTLARDAEFLAGVYEARRNDLRDKAKNDAKNDKTVFYDQAIAALRAKNSHGNPIVSPATVELFGNYIEANSDAKNWRAYTLGQRTKHYTWGRRDQYSREDIKAYLNHIDWDSKGGLAFVDVTTSRPKAHDPNAFVLEVGVSLTDRDGNDHVTESFYGEKHATFAGNIPQHKITLDDLAEYGQDTRALGDHLAQQLSNRVVVAYQSETIKPHIDRLLIAAGHQPIREWIDMQKLIPEDIPHSRDIHQTAEHYGVKATNDSILGRTLLTKQLFFETVDRDQIPATNAHHNIRRLSCFPTRDNPEHFGETKPFIKPVKPKPVPKPKSTRKTRKPKPSLRKTLGAVMPVSMRQPKVKRAKPVPMPPPGVQPKGLDALKKDLGLD